MEILNDSVLRYRLQLSAVLTSMNAQNLETSNSQNPTNGILPYVLLFCMFIEFWPVSDWSQ